MSTLTAALNWQRWRRDVMLVVIGVHAMMGGGQSPLLAAGFKTISKQFDVSLTKVAYTTGLFNFALGIGSVLAGPTAVIWGKRPVYLAGQIVFLSTCLWAAFSQSYASLLAARIIEGFGVSPVECLPSSSIAELFFVHERTFRIGIYSALLLSGKSLVPLASAAVIEAYSWRVVFLIVASVVALNLLLTFIFVAESAWDRTVRPTPSLRSVSRRTSKETMQLRTPNSGDVSPPFTDTPQIPKIPAIVFASEGSCLQVPLEPKQHRPGQSRKHSTATTSSVLSTRRLVFEVPMRDIESFHNTSHIIYKKKTWTQQLALTQGRATETAWWKIALRPFVLYAYPAVLFSTLLYSMSIVWLIVLSESLGQIFQTRPYEFNALQVGLIYCSPFIGSVLGSAVTGKASDMVARYMCRKNDGIFEPEFKLVMLLPVLLTSAIGLLGFGWSTQLERPWIVPTFFFGSIGFGSSLGCTLAISLVVDSYDHATEALVTMNFTKNTLGFIFSLWFNEALTENGPKRLFAILAGIQITICLAGVPLYIFGKRARYWTHKAGMMDWLYD